MPSQKTADKKNDTKREKIAIQREGAELISHSSPPVNRMLHLQRTIGNQAVQSLYKSGAIQAKLNINQPNDFYEQEADRVADQVMRMPDNVGVGQIQRRPLTFTSLVQRQSQDEEETLQTKGSSSNTPTVTHSIESNITSLKGGGRPLDSATRAYFESRFGHDFSNVRLHTSPQAADTAKSINAKAFTSGENIVFGAGQYSSDSPEGKRLLGHELTHVVQQRSFVANDGPLMRKEKQRDDYGDVAKEKINHVKHARDIAAEIAARSRSIFDTWAQSPDFNSPIGIIFLGMFNTKDGRDIEKVKDVLDQVSGTLNARMSFKLGEKDGCKGDAGKRDPAAYVNYSLPVNLCPPFFDSDDWMSAITLIHEAVHLAGIHPREHVKEENGVVKKIQDKEQYEYESGDGYDCSPRKGTGEDVRLNADRYAHFIVCLYTGGNPVKPRIEMPPTKITIPRLQRASLDHAKEISNSPVIQPKLNINQPNDFYEQEADRVSEQVMRMPDDAGDRQIQHTPLTFTPLAQRQSQGEEETLQTKGSSSNTPAVTPSIESNIASLKGGGRPLDPLTRAFFEPRFGCDFSNVRVHTGPSAAESARAINAKAFTLGQDVVFGAGQYASGSPEGKRLLGHELTHVVQQDNKTKAIQRAEKPLNLNASSFRGEIFEWVDIENWTTKLRKEGYSIIYANPVLKGPQKGRQPAGTKSFDGWVKSAFPSQTHRPDLIAVNPDKKEILVGDIAPSEKAQADIKPGEQTKIPHGTSSESETKPHISKTIDDAKQVVRNLPEELSSYTIVAQDKYYAENAGARYSRKIVVKKGKLTSRFGGTKGTPGSTSATPQGGLGGKLETLSHSKGMPIGPISEADVQTNDLTLDKLLLEGPVLTYPVSTAVKQAQKDLKVGRISQVGIEALLQQVAADFRTEQIADSGTLSNANLWLMCGAGQDTSALSLGTLTRESSRPIKVYRFQAKDVFEGANQHAFAVFEFPGEIKYLVDLTFSQFMLAHGQKNYMKEKYYTANILRDGGLGQRMAEELISKGYIALDNAGEIARLYAKGLGVSEDKLDVLAERLMTGEKAFLIDFFGEGKGPTLDYGSIKYAPVGVVEKIDFLRKDIEKVKSEGDQKKLLSALYGFLARLEEEIPQRTQRSNNDNLRTAHGASTPNPLALQSGGSTGLAKGAATDKAVLLVGNRETGYTAKTPVVEPPRIAAESREGVATPRPPRRLPLVAPNAPDRTAEPIPASTARRANISPASKMILDGKRGAVIESGPPPIAKIDTESGEVSFETSKHDELEQGRGLRSAVGQKVGPAAASGALLLPVIEEQLEMLSKIRDSRLARSLYTLRWWLQRGITPPTFNAVTDRWWFQRDDEEREVSKIRSGLKEQKFDGIVIDRLTSKDYEQYKQFATWAQVNIQSWDDVYQHFVRWDAGVRLDEGRKWQQTVWQWNDNPPANVYVEYFEDKQIEAIMEPILARLSKNTEEEIKTLPHDSKRLGGHTIAGLRKFRKGFFCNASLCDVSLYTPITLNELDNGIKRHFEPLFYEIAGTNFGNYVLVAGADIHTWLLIHEKRADHDRVGSPEIKMPGSEWHQVSEKKPFTGFENIRVPVCLVKKDSLVPASSEVVQPKLNINQPGDLYEQEADRVAEQVENSNKQGAELQGTPLPITPLVQRQATQTPNVTTCIESNINSLNGLGQPLDPATRAYFEPRFGQDFSHVRVHTNSAAADSAHAINAKAFTLGHDVVFGAGQYASDSPEGKRLLGHELTHVVQQNSVSARSLQRQEDKSKKDLDENEADMHLNYHFRVHQLSPEEFTNVTGAMIESIPEATMIPLSSVQSTSGPSVLAPALAGAAHFAPSPWSFIPANSTGISWIQGHASIWANPQGGFFSSPTIRGYRGNMGWYLGELLPFIGKNFTVRLNEGVPGAFANDLWFPLMPGPQSYVYVPRDQAMAEAFAKRLRGTKYSGTYTYSPPRAPQPANASFDPVLGPVGKTESKIYGILTARGKAPKSTNNCITVPQPEIVAAIDGKPMTTSGIDVMSGAGPDGAVDNLYRGKGKLMADATAKGPLPPGAQRLVVTPGAGTSMFVMRVGGRVMLIYGIYQTEERVRAAMGTDQLPTVLAEETGSWGGGMLAAAGGGALAGAIFCSPTGPIDAVCIIGGGLGSLLFGYGGSKIGSELGHTAVEGRAPEGGILDTVSKKIEEPIIEFNKNFEFNIVNNVPW